MEFDVEESRVEKPFVLGVQLFSFFIIALLAIFIFSSTIMRTLLGALAVYLAYKFLK